MKPVDNFFANSGHRSKFGSTGRRYLVIVTGERTSSLATTAPAQKKRLSWCEKTQSERAARQTAALAEATRKRFFVPTPTRATAKSTTLALLK